MDNKKDPPYFNGHNLRPLHPKGPASDSMEIFIETLTGAGFGLKVSPFETVRSVKMKIQRLEGIDISQQRLVWNDLELQDHYCLRDYGIYEGCTLKLVLAMRGGPINTRRENLNRNNSVVEPPREISEYIDAVCDKFLENAPPEKEVTFFVYRDGDQLNYFQVYEKGDGTFTPTPASEALSRGSIDNIYGEDLAEAPHSRRQIIENSRTKHKMRMLKTKMEIMNLSKEPKKAMIQPRPPMAPRPPAAPRSSGGLMAADRHRYLRVLPHIVQACPTPHAPPATPQPPQPSQLSRDYQNNDERWDSAILSPSGIELPSKIARMEVDSVTSPKKTILTSVAHPLKQAGIFKENLTSKTEDEHGFDRGLPNSILYSAGENTMPEADVHSLFPKISPTEYPPELFGVRRVNPAHGSSNGAYSPPPERPLSPISKSLSLEPGKGKMPEMHKTRTQRNKLLSPLLYSAEVVKPQRHPDSFDIGSLRAAASQTVLKSLEARNMASDSTPTTARFRGVKVNSAGKRSDIISKTEGGGVTEMANKVSKEPIELFAALARSTSRESLHNACATSRLRTSTVALPSNLQTLQDEGYRQTSSPTRTADFSSRVLGMNGNHATTGRRLVEATPLLPPVKNRNRMKKKSSKHCFVCWKKTGVITSFPCVVTISVQLIATQRPTIVLMITKLKAGDACRKQIQRLLHPNFQKYDCCM